jgi:hypothetical protein
MAWILRQRALFGMLDRSAELMPSACAKHRSVGNSERSISINHYARVPERLLQRELQTMKRYNTRRPLDVTQSTSVDFGTVFAADFALHPHAQMNSSQFKLNEDDARKLSKGDRVHLSELGCSRHPRDTEKKGTIVGNSQ